MFFVRHITSLHKWYERNERLFSSISLVAGFIFDIVTLKRVDLFWENVWIIAHLAVAAIGIVVLNLFKKRSQSAIHFYLIILIQFAFGGLFSTFLVFYFRSATLATSWPFILFLVVVFISNEVLKKQYLRVSFQIGVFFVALYAFAIYALPVVVHRISDLVFIGSGVVSIVMVWMLLRILRWAVPDVYHESRWSIAASIIVVLIVINTLYFTRLIPPLPLSLKDSGVFHGVVKTKSGDYEVSYEPRTFIEKVSHYIFSNQVFHKKSGESVYVYGAVFSPAALTTETVHEWQWYDPAAEAWLVTNRFPITIVGGREGGYRSYSVKSNPRPGLWRVHIATKDNRIIGRISFEVVGATDPVVLETTIKR